MLKVKRQQESDQGIGYGLTKISDYTQMEELGKGTYGIVSKYLHRPTGTIVAIKHFKLKVNFKKIL